MGCDVATLRDSLRNWAYQTIERFRRHDGQAWEEADISKLWGKTRYAKQALMRKRHEAACVELDMPWETLDSDLSSRFEHGEMQMANATEARVRNMAEE
jgi:hypothetical protein